MLLNDAFVVCTRLGQLVQALIQLLYLQLRRLQFDKAIVLSLQRIIENGMIESSYIFCVKK